MKRITAILFIFCLLLTTSMASAQVKDIIRGNAKFNSVIIVIGIIFGGIVFFLFRMDRRLNKLEKEKENKK